MENISAKSIPTLLGFLSIKNCQNFIYKGKKMNNFFIAELSKIFKINYENTEKILVKLQKTIRKEKIITKNLLARGIIHNLNKIKKEKEMENKDLVLLTYKHSCLSKFYNKFLELVGYGWGAQKISNYFINSLNCGISKTYLINVLKLLTAQNEQKIINNNSSNNIPKNKKDNDFFIKKLGAEFKLNTKNTKHLLNRVSSLLSKQTNITKIFIAKSILQNFRVIKKEEEELYKLLILGTFKHKCLQKHYIIFLDLMSQNWKSQKISNYFKNSLNCGISTTYVNNVLDFFKKIEIEEEKEN